MRAENRADISIGLRKRGKKSLPTQSFPPNDISVGESPRILHQLGDHRSELEKQNDELRTAQLELEHLNHYTAELEARNKELDAFAYTVSHDLKNPLSIILGYAELLADDFETLSPEKIFNSITTIAKSANKMNEIMDSLLLLAKMGRTEVPIAPLDTASIMAGVRHMLGPHD